MEDYSVEYAGNGVVDYSSFQWQGLWPGDYSLEFNATATVQGNFPVTRTGRHPVMYKYIIFNHNPTTKEVMKAIEAAGLRRPDRAETDTFIDAHPEEEAEYRVVGICGAEFKDDRDKEPGVGCVLGTNQGSGLFLVSLHFQWTQNCLFLAVSPNAPTSTSVEE